MSFFYFSISRYIWYSIFEFEWNEIGYAWINILNSNKKLQNINVSFKNMIRKPVWMIIMRTYDNISYISDSSSEFIAKFFAYNILFKKII